MSALLDEVPEARAFLEEVMNNADEYKLFEQEHFAGLAGGIIATTGVDNQREQLTLHSMCSLVEQHSENAVWNLAEHNPLIQPIGRSLAARMFYAPVSKGPFRSSRHRPL